MAELQTKASQSQSRVAFKTTAMLVTILLAQQPAVVMYKYIKVHTALEKVEVMQII